MSLHKLGDQHHFILMAQYNQRMNQQVYAAAGQLSEQQLNEDRGAFFYSVLATLNHILVGDLNWLRRFAKFSPDYQTPDYQTLGYQRLKALADFPYPQSLADVPFKNFSELKLARENLDQILLAWACEELTEQDLKQDLIYQNSAGESFARNFAELIHHLFNHQTHHRGQLSTLLSQLGIDIGATDFVLDIPAR